MIPLEKISAYGQNWKQVEYNMAYLRKKLSGAEYVRLAYSLGAWWWYFETSAPKCCECGQVMAVCPDCLEEMEEV
jgi:hypothetical protein